MTSPLCTLDVARMRRGRIEKVRTAMDAAGVDVLLCCSQSNVSYVTGARVPSGDHARAGWWRPVAVFRREEDWPHLYTWFPDGAPADLPAEHLRAGVRVEAADGAEQLARALPRGVLALDDAPFPLWQAVRDRNPIDASVVLAPAKLTKTRDELECIRQAQSLNERAMRAVRPLAVPGARATDLSGAFLRAVAELGAHANTVDPVFQVMPASVGAGPYSVTGETVFPLPTREQRLAAGDVMWVDSGINLYGYASDFGATWIIGREPDDRARVHFARWRDVVDHVLAVVRAGATGADLVRAAGTHHGERPWLSYFYLAHGIGTDSAEMPFVGTDLGDGFDASLVLAPGMVLVFEPVIWEDGTAGHRSEEIVAVTADGYEWLSSRAELDGGLSS
ncbi:MAG TPA: M24 family metallopeptidase [Acidimicrobiia bacterium]|nr:M24 family metallopeptidase [Acidimicrobiia bacterium]